MASDWRKREERNEIVDYIKNTLPQKLQNDQLKCKILTETDLHTCVFSRIDRLLIQKKFENWFILNEPSLVMPKGKKKKPDIVICWKKDKIMHPVILIELKEKKTFGKTSIDKDTKKLIKILKENENKLNLQRTRIYFNCQILALTSDKPEIIRKNDPKEVAKTLQEKVDNELQKAGIAKKRIQVIVINAFYSRDFERRREALEKIRALRKITVGKREK
tara:strand:- start:3 stop:659 length:657 start_codon:yes stop_codon:yes gene_type:complete